MEGPGAGLNSRAGTGSLRRKAEGQWEGSIYGGRRRREGQGRVQAGTGCGGSGYLSSRKDGQGLSVLLKATLRFFGASGLRESGLLGTEARVAVSLVHVGT